MSSSMATELDTLSSPSPEARAAARRYMESSGNADLLDMLGLVDAKPRERAICPACKQQYYPGRRDCRSRSCERGPASRKAKR